MAGQIQIGYFKNGGFSPGNFIQILSEGDFRVGEYYLKNGGICDRRTWYNTDGTCKKFVR